MKNFLIVALCLGFLGCAHVERDTAPKPLVEPEYGMTKEQVLALMGKPDSFEIYQKNDQSRVEFDIYVRHYPSEYKLPICLVNNKVVGWGEAYYEDHAFQDGMTRVK